MLDFLDFFELLEAGGKGRCRLFWTFFLNFWTREKMQTFLTFFEFFGGHVVLSGIATGGHFKVEV
jgi:hypothetical protein